MTPDRCALAVAVRRDLDPFRLEVTFTVEAGLAVVVGPSGAGKSLTLALIAGLDRPDQGTIHIDGQVVADAGRGIHVRTQQRQIGMVFQDALLLPHRRVLDNVALAVPGGNRRGRRDVAAGWLERVGAVELADRHPWQLSGGQRQRVALARALARRPRLLLLDEPFSALDQPTRRDLRRLVRSLVDSTGVPTVFVTHDPIEAGELADTLITYEHGAVVSVERRARHRAPARRR